MAWKLQECGSLGTGPGEMRRVSRGGRDGGRTLGPLGRKAVASMRGPPGYGEHLGTYGGVASRSAGGAPQLAPTMFRVPRRAPDGVLYGDQHSNPSL